MADKTEVTVKTNGSTPQRFDPFERFAQLEREFERLWTETWPFALRPLPRVTAMSPGFYPAMDVYEKDGNVVLKAELPGMKAEDVEITIEEGNLIVKGEKKAESEVKEKDYYHVERSYGSFYRSLKLPEATKPEQITATFKDGVLEVTVPKPAETKPEGTKIRIATT